MTEEYFISTSPRISGSHTVHKHGCPFLPDPGKRIPLGIFQSAKEAIMEGRGFFRRAERCPFCSKEHSETENRVIAVNQINPELISTARIQKTAWLDLMFCSLS